MSVSLYRREILTTFKLLIPRAAFTEESPARGIRSLKVVRISRLYKETDMATAATATPSTPKERDWTKPSAMAIPKEGFFTPKQGRYGPIYPHLAACDGFNIMANIKLGREDVFVDDTKTTEKAIADLPDAL